MNPEQLFSDALRHHHAGDLASAEESCRRLLTQAPDNAAAWHFLGVIALQTGRTSDALEWIRAALQYDPRQPEFHNSLGQTLTAAGQHDAAIAAYREAIRLRPGYVKAHHNLGVSLQGLGQREAALTAFARAVELAPDWVEGHRCIGDLHRDQGRPEAAVAAYRTALQLAPHSSVIETNLAVSLRQLGRLEEAIALLRGTLAAQPDFQPARINLALLLREQGNLAESLAAYREAMRRGTVSASFHSGYLFLLHCDPACGVEQLLAEHRKWAELHLAPWRAIRRGSAASPNPERPLRVGYVSADLHEHPVGRNVHPLFAHHDRQAFEIHAYAQVDEPDALSAELRTLVHAWHDIGALDDEQLAARIREDGIDVLVDLSLHTEGNRLLVFARRPAPVQVTFAGYPSTTGVEAIDFRLTDPFLDPSGTRDGLYVEQSHRLPHSFWCYDPFGAPAEPARPRDLTAPLTWGCLNNPIRINAQVLDAWGQIMREVADSGLVVLAHNRYHRERIVEALHVHGIRRERIEFVPKQPRPVYLETYRRCDAILDTFPYNGHTTTCDALWMGVPVITRVGDTAVARGGLSLLSNLDLAHLAGATTEDYVRIAVDLARDRSRLDQLRSTVHERMIRSPLMDGAGFARAIEAAYRTMWRAWCAQARS